MTQSSRTGKSTSKGADAPTDIAGMKFETALAELERIVGIMEDGHLPLDESITAYRRGSELLGHCQRQLSDAERRVRVFEDDELRDCAREDAR